MTDLKQLFGSYNICARFAPGFLFVLTLYFLLGYDIAYLESNSIIFIALIIILSAISGFISASISKIFEQSFWKLIGNPTILYLKRYQTEIYNELSEKYKDDNKIITNILKTTRGDSKLFWKNVVYGFFRNSILLSIACLFFSYQTQYFCWNLIVSLLVVFITCASTYYYAHQAIESYREVIANQD